MSKTKFKVEVQHAQFVPLSDVMKDLPKAAEAFQNSDPDCDWGNNNRTLVTPQTVIDGLEKMLGDSKGIDNEINTALDRLEAVKTHNDNADGNIYIDLES